MVLEIKVNHVLVADPKTVNSALPGINPPTEAGKSVGREEAGIPLECIVSLLEMINWKKACTMSYHVNSNSTQMASWLCKVLLPHSLTPVLTTL